MLEHIAHKLLKIAQNIINKEYEKNGLEDDILDIQVRLNQLTNKYNVNFDGEWKQ